MGREVRPHQTAVEGPVVLGVGRRVDAHVAAAGGDIVLERLLLVGVEDITGGGEEHHRVVAGQVVGGELRARLGGVDLDPGGRAQLLQRGDTLGDRVMTEPCGPGEDQNALLGPARLGRGDLEVVQVEEGTPADTTLEDQEQLGGLLRYGAQRYVDVLEGLPAAGDRDGRGAQQLTGGGTRAYFEEPRRLPPEEIRAVRVLDPFRLYGVKEIQSPSSMSPTVLPPLAGALS